jgi:lipopolysaccharide heptosyltransferase I
MKILILKPSSLGDVIHALPVLRLLRLHYPASEIFWWIDSALAPLIAGDPDLTGIIRFERKRWAKPQHWPEMLRSIGGMRAQQFDLVIDLQSLLRSAAFAWLARGKFLAGLDDPREGANGFYDLAVPRKDFHTHAVDWYLSVLTALKIPVHKNFIWLPERKEIADDVKRKWPDAFVSNPQSAIRNPQLILLQPGARWENKRWPAEHFSALVHALEKNFPAARFAVLGGKDDATLGEKISAAAPEKVLNLCGQTSLPEMIEVVRRGDLLITNDTGPMHVAAALGQPLLALFGPTAPERTGPYGQLPNVLRHPLPCAPCMSSDCHFAKPLECLRALTPETVLRRAQAIFS